MRIPKYLSPTSIKLFMTSPQEYYISHMADVRPPAIPQTQPMSIGSAFDAYAKSFISERLFGKGVKPDFEFEKIFESQVEPHNRDWARVHGKHVFDFYMNCGAMADLMLDLQDALTVPRLEFTVEHNVMHAIDMGGVKLYGKPDVFYVNKKGRHVLLDWKVNGYCAQRATSPKPGYVCCRDGVNKSMHKECNPIMVDGIIVNASSFLETVDEDWAQQLAIYGWILGEPVGSEFFTRIEQIVGCGNGIGMPKLRVATHSSRISGPFQLTLFKNVSRIWKAVQSGHVFENLSRQENDERCVMLDKYGEGFDGSFMDEVIRGGHRNF